MTTTYTFSHNTHTHARTHTCTQARTHKFTTICCKEDVLFDTKISPILGRIQIFQYGC